MTVSQVPCLLVPGSFGDCTLPGKCFLSHPRHTHIQWLPSFSTNPGEDSTITQLAIKSTLITSSHHKLFLLIFCSINFPVKYYRSPLVVDRRLVVQYIGRAGKSLRMGNCRESFQEDSGTFLATVSASSLGTDCDRIHQYETILGLADVVTAGGGIRRAVRVSYTSWFTVTPFTILACSVW